MTRHGRRWGRFARTFGLSRGDHDQWMEMFSTLDDDELDALMAGSSPADARLEPVAEVVRALRRVAAREPSPPMPESLRVELASPVVVPIGIQRATRSALVRAAAVAAVFALLGLGAAQNRLPTGIQDVVSSTADLVGVDVPRAEERHADGEGLGTGDSQGEADAQGGTTNDTARGNDGEPGHDEVTPGGAVPADPGTPGDHEPATPAVPPATSDGGGGGSEAKDLTPSSSIPAAQANGNPSAPSSGTPPGKKAG